MEEMPRNSKRMVALECVQSSNVALFVYVPKAQSLGETLQLFVETSR